MKPYYVEFKAKVVLEAVKGLKTSSELAREYQVFALILSNGWDPPQTHEPNSMIKAACYRVSSREHRHRFDETKNIYGEKVKHMVIPPKSSGTQK